MKARRQEKTAKRHPGPPFMKEPPPHRTKPSVNQPTQGWNVVCRRITNRQEPPVTAQECRGIPVDQTGGQRNPAGTRRSPGTLKPLRRRGPATRWRQSPAFTSPSPANPFRTGNKQDASLLVGSVMRDPESGWGQRTVTCFVSHSGRDIPQVVRTGSRDVEVMCKHCCGKESEGQRACDVTSATPGTGVHGFGVQM
ncbi:hypothetical protein NDU88_000168 [Pleurodeles waltl]|uniref:Uncharacterized protein n=1 Tax=Pleurodeles waltl TaxID=8319 RepID=A0AAV7N8Q2_PLEWA|nr:hypothetical protein NDU88_000168 [Pleurodeles waltl]